MWVCVSGEGAVSTQGREGSVGTPHACAPAPGPQSARIVSKDQAGPHPTLWAPGQGGGCPWTRQVGER